MSTKLDSFNVALMIDDIIDAPATNGVTYRFLNIARHLGGKENVHVFIADRGGSAIDNIREMGIKATVFPSSWLYDSDKYANVVDLFKRKNVDIIHVCNSHSMVPVFGFKLANELNARLVCDMHDIYSDLTQDFNKKIAEDKSQLTVANNCDHIFVMSKFDYPRLIEMGIPKGHMTWSPNGIDPKLRRSHTLNKKNAVFIGNMYYPPNAEAAQLIIERIAPEVRKHAPDTLFNFIGNVPAELASHKENGVVFHGMQPDLQHFFNNASLALAPLRSGGGMKVKMLDYGSFGLPVVGTSIAMMGYEPNKGFIVEDSVEGLVNACVQLLHDDSLALRCGDAARDYVEQNFSWETLISNQYSTYQKIYNTPKARGNVNFYQTDNGDIIVDNTKVEYPQHLLEDRYKKARHDQISSVFELN